MYKILIIEDEKETADCVQEALRLESIESDIAFDGEEAIKKFETNEYDLILLDLKLPKLDGSEVLKKIRTVNPFIDVIVYTNFTEFNQIKQLTNLGIDGYINKGSESDLKELVNLIREKLSPLDIEDIEKLFDKAPIDIDDR